MNSWRQKAFRRSFESAEFRKSRAGYEGINPDRALETSGITFVQTEPLLHVFVPNDRSANAFVHEFLS
jgi:hypothetical protein